MVTCSDVSVPRPLRGSPMNAEQWARYKDAEQSTQPERCESYCRELWPDQSEQLARATQEREGLELALNCNFLPKAYILGFHGDRAGYVQWDDTGECWEAYRSQQPPRKTDADLNRLLDRMDIKDSPRSNNRA